MARPGAAGHVKAGMAVRVWVRLDAAGAAGMARYGWARSGGAGMARNVVVRLGRRGTVGYGLVGCDEAGK